MSNETERVHQAQHRPRLLFISPVTPLETGNGLGMRAGATIRTLAKSCDVSLLVVPLYDTQPLDQLAPSIAGVLTDAAMLFNPADRESGADLPGWDDLLDWPFITRRFDIVHVFRLSTIEWADPYLTAPNRPARHLDIDDIESITHYRLARIARFNGDRHLARQYDELADRYTEIERWATTQFDRIYVCSEGDAALLRGNGRAEIMILPNQVTIPAAVPPEPVDEPFRFLFIGTLGYYPNADGIRWFNREVLPRLRERTSVPFVVDVVGGGISDTLHRDTAAPEINLVGWLPEIAEAYRRANAVIVPLRAGGGTRIKVLEAMAWRRAIVSTPVGVEGIAIEHNVHVLIGQTPEAFADHCRALIEDPALRASLADAGHAFVSHASTLPISFEPTAIAHQPARAHPESQ